MDPIPSTPAAPAPTVRPHRRLLAVVLAGGLAAVLVVVALAAFFFLRGSGDVLVRAVPADATVYAAVYLDPSGAQKVNANNLLARFPKVGTQSQRDSLVNGWLDTALQDQGLSHSDVRAWLGTQISIAVGGTINLSDSNPPDSAVLIASTNDSAASTALGRMRNATGGTWSVEQYDGSTIAYTATGAYVVTSNIAVIGTTRGYVENILDTLAGKRAALSGDATYKNTLASLPADRLVVAYLNVAKLADALDSQGNVPAETLAQVKGYTGVGMAVTAQTDGVQMDWTMRFDPSRIDPATRSAIGGDHVNQVLHFTPAKAYGLLALTHFDHTLTMVISLAASFAGDVTSTLDRMGITGDHGIIADLAGDAGVAVYPDPATSGGTGGVLLLASKNDDALSSFMASLPTTLGCTTPTGDPCPAATSDDNGTTITTVTASLEQGTTLAWALHDHMLIVGSSTQAVRAAVDASSGNDVTSAAAYRTVIAHSTQNNAGMIYLDVPAIAAAVRDSLDGSAQADYDSNAAPWVKPVGGAVLTSVTGADHVDVRIFVAIH